MNEEYKVVNEAGGRYLILPVPENPDELEMGMLMKLSGDAVLSPKLLFDEGKSYMSFDISDCIGFKGKIAEKTLTESDIVMYVAQLKNAADTLNKYLLGDENLLLDPDVMFVDKISSELKLCAYFSSDIKNEKNTYIRRIAHEFLLGIDINDDKVVRLCMKLYREAQKDECSLFDLINEVIRDRSCPEPSVSKVAIEPEAAMKEDIYKESDSVKTPINITDLDRDSYDDIYGDSNEAEDENTSMQYSESDASKNTPGDVLIKIIITQTIMLAGIAAVAIFKGMPIALRILPVYAILAVCTILYFLIGAWAERKKERAAC